MCIRKGEGNLLRNLDGTVGRPRGANDRIGLGEGGEGEEGDETLSFSSEDDGSSTPVTSSTDSV
jgi:hypothetical protein